MKNKSADRSPENNWKPRNKQAGFVVRKANELLLHTPPLETTKAPTLAERLEAESKARLARIALIEKEAKERIERRKKARELKFKPQKPKVWKHMWAAKYLKRLNKSRGLPPPTTEEIRKFREKQPNFGKLL